MRVWNGGVLLVLLILTGACKEKLLMKLTSLETDSVTVAGIGPGSAVVIANGRRDGEPPCSKGYELSVPSPSAQFANRLSSAPCEAYVAAFGTGRGMALEDASHSWTDKPGDQVAITVAPERITIPLNIFILSGDQYAATGQDPVVSRQNIASDNVTRAVQLYDDFQAGISFSVNGPFDETSGDFDASLLTTDCTGEGIGPFKAIDPTKTSVRGVNIFYSGGIDADVPNPGITCADGSSAVIVIAQKAYGDTLAHELGHALSLNHTNDYGVPSDNLMLSPTPDNSNDPTKDPASLTVGQTFRMNVNGLSVANAGSYRTGPTKTCPESAGAPDCPDITLRPQP